MNSSAPWDCEIPWRFLFSQCERMTPFPFMVVGGASSSPVRDATSRSHKEGGTFGDDSILFTLTPKV